MGETVDVIALVEVEDSVGTASVAFFKGVVYTDDFDDAADGQVGGDLTVVEETMCDAVVDLDITNEGEDVIFCINGDETTV